MPTRSSPCPALRCPPSSSRRRSAPSPGLLGLVFLLTSLSSPATAQEPVVEKLDHAEIDWTAGAIVASGTGNARKNIESVADRRLEAEKRAKDEGQRHVVEALAQMQITPGVAGAERLREPVVRAQVDAVVKSCKAQDTRYYSDGAVDVVLRCPIPGGLAVALAPGGSRAPLPEGGASTATGLVIDASGVKATPMLVPTLLTAEGRPILEATTPSAEALRTLGGVVYVGSMGEAEAHPRAGKSPVVLDVADIDRGGAWRIQAGQESRLEGVDRRFLRDGKVVVVLAQSAVRRRR